MERSILDMAGTSEVGRRFLGNQQRSWWISGLLCYSNIAAVWSAAWVSDIIYDQVISHSIISTSMKYLMPT